MAFNFEALDFVRHAKLYALESQYLLMDLRYICLHKLHRHLANFVLTSDNVDERAELLTFINTSTRDGGDILKNTTDPLRRLVIVYVAARSEKILEYNDFHEMLGAGGPHTADFIALKFI